MSYDDAGFDAYWEELQALALKHGELVADVSAWRENFDAGQTAAQAFYEEYPEHRATP